MALAVLLALSLFSYNPDDPSFNNQFSEPQKTANLAGVAGSYLSDLFFQIFGLTAFLWPFVLILFKTIAQIATGCGPEQPSG